MNTHDAQSLLDRIQEIGNACDLDLLLFFHRHPCALLTSEQLVAYLGYDSEQVARSLDGLIEAGILRRFQIPTHAPRLYVLEPRSAHGGSVDALLKLASTREGRRDVMRLLRRKHEPSSGANPQHKGSLIKVA